jgi:bifunctional DNA-binding transcriptional regulator/antitoxin component of YhaV-PrlF toxin-antitoxin module
MKRFEAVLEPLGQAAAVTLPFDPKAEWGKVRAPVRGTIDGYPFTTTVARYGGVDYLGFRLDVREAAGVEVGDVVAIEVDLDTEERVVAVPEDLAAALADARVRDAFDRLSYTHQKEYVAWVEEAKREETRKTRISRSVELLQEGVRTPK